MSRDVVGELRAKYEAGTCGPWRSEGRFSVVSDPEPGWFVAECRSYEGAVLRGPESESTRDLIVAMHKHLPALLAVAEAARRVADLRIGPYMMGALEDEQQRFAELKIALSALTTDEGERCE